MLKTVTTSTISPASLSFRAGSADIRLVPEVGAMSGCAREPLSGPDESPKQGEPPSDGMERAYLVRNVLPMDYSQVSESVRFHVITRPVSFALIQ